MLGVQLEAKPIYRFQLVYIHQQFVQLAVVLHLQQSLELVETPLPQVALAILGQDVRQQLLNGARRAHLFLDEVAFDLLFKIQIVAPLRLWTFGFHFLDRCPSARELRSLSEGHQEVVFGATVASADHGIVRTFVLEFLAAIAGFIWLLTIIVCSGKLGFICILHINRFWFFSCKSFPILRLSKFLL